MSKIINFKKGDAIPLDLKRAWGIHPNVKAYFKTDMQVMKDGAGNYITRIGASNEENQNFSVGDSLKRMCLQSGD